MLYNFSNLGTAEIIAISHKTAKSMFDSSSVIKSWLLGIQAGKNFSIDSLNRFDKGVNQYCLGHKILENLYKEGRYEAFDSLEKMKYFLDITDFSLSYLKNNIRLMSKNITQMPDDYDVDTVTEFLNENLYSHFFH